MSVLSRWVAATALACMAGTAAADNQPENVTVGEMALLPEYCEDVQGFKYGDASYNTSPRAAHWVGLMGPTFWAFHHYCWALIRIHRAQKAGVKPVIREGLLRGAIGDLGYVVAHATPKFVMLPEVYLRIGESYVALMDFPAAQDAFARSREAKRDYWPPYVRWSDVLVKLGRKDQARSHIEEALRIMPTEPALIAQYRKLGGNPTDFLKTVKPVAETVPVAAAASEPASGAGAGAAASQPTN